MIEASVFGLFSCYNLLHTHTHTHTQDEVLEEVFSKSTDDPELEG
jgi:hypothetical protein